MLLKEYLKPKSLENNRRLGCFGKLYATILLDVGVQVCLE